MKHDTAGAGADKISRKGAVGLVRRRPFRQEKLTDADRRGLSALFWSHLNLYGKFELDMSKQLDLGPVLE